MILVPRFFHDTRNRLLSKAEGISLSSRRQKKEKQDAAWKFIKWMTSTENAARWSLGSGYVAVKKAAFEAPEYKEYLAKWPQAKTAYYQLEIAERNMMTHRVNELVDLVNRTIERVMGGGDLDEALRDAQAKADKIFLS